MEGFSGSVPSQEIITTGFPGQTSITLTGRSSEFAWFFMKVTQSSTKGKLQKLITCIKHISKN